MAATSVVNVSKDWTLLANGSCLVQAKNALVQYDICVQAAKPAAQDSNYISSDLANATIFDFGSSVWCRINSGTYANTSTLVVIA